MNKVYIIAEAGVNHNGDIALAKRMVDIAASAGADAIKFQAFTAQKLVSKSAKKAQYQKKTTDKNESQFDMLKKLELGIDAHRKLMHRCRKKGIAFLSSPFDLDSIDSLNRLGLKIFKIPSGEITNLPYLRKIGSLRKKIIMSTGMASLKEVKSALRVLKKSGTARKNITVLHCSTEYPAPFKGVNLSAMVTMRKALKVKTGYSDHTTGTEVAIAAAALGATVIEKHFTLDSNMKGPDHKASLNPDGFKAMVNAIRNLGMAMGNGVKRPSASEIKNKMVVRKSIVAAGFINKGEIFTPENITTKRPANGISPTEWDNVVGKTAKRDFNEDDAIEL